MMMLRRICVFVVAIQFLSSLLWADTATPEAKSQPELNLHYPVTNRIEIIYDRDHNGQLENFEVLYFLRDVLKAVQNKGRFNVISNILAEYDLNRDGSISRQEARNIENFLY